MGIWAALYNPSRRFEPHPDRSPEWNRGAYLAEGFAHCGDCHTPRNIAQALDNRRKFSGALTAGWRAYNITPDAASGIGSWSDEDLAAYLRSGHAAGHGSAGGPMAEEIAVSLAPLTAEDLHAVITYLRSVPAMHSKDSPAVLTVAASDAPKEIRAAATPDGREIFAGACMSCHAWSGQSLVSSYASLTGDRAVNDPSATNVVQMILSGSHGNADHRLAMPAFGQAYSDTEIAAVANYVTARFGAEPSQLTARDVARLRALTSP